MKYKSEMRTITVIGALLICTAAVGQKDQAALTVLDSFSKKAFEAPSVSVTFRLINNDLKENKIDTISGTAIISGDKYKLSLPSNTIWSDGSTSWSFLDDVNEVTINNYDPKDKSFTSRPSLLFSMYREDYKIRLIEETPKYWVIDLYPEKLDNSMIRIRLKIGRPGYNLKSAEYKTKDGVLVTLLADKYDLTLKPDSNFFIFDITRHKGVEINDMR